MPLDADEEDQFRLIVTQLREEDPTLGQPGGRDRIWRIFGRCGPFVVLFVALGSLPVALALGLYPLGLVGYLAATLAAVRLADHHVARRLWDRVPWPSTTPAAADAGTTGPVGADDQPAVDVRSSGPRLPRAARGALLAGLTLLVVVAISPDAGGPAGDQGDTAPGPVAEPVTEAPTGDQPPTSRRSAERSAASAEAPAPSPRAG